MTAIEPSGQILGATVRGLDLAKPLSDAHFATILEALGRHGVLRFPSQKLEAIELRDFSRRFGQIQATLTGRHHEPGMPEVGYLSNIIENGEPIGITDAGQDWHTDMSYNETIGFLNVLYAVKVPRRDGQVLGATMFANTQAAYEDLAPELKAPRERDGHPRLQQVLGEHAPPSRQPAGPAHRRAAPPAAAVRPSALSHASDHGPEGALLQPRLRDPHQRARRG
jgi:alpha-ketoglutarate-dependent taurine dioxygenase